MALGAGKDLDLDSEARGPNLSLVFDLLAGLLGLFVQRRCKWGLAFTTEGGFYRKYCTDIMEHNGLSTYPLVSRCQRSSKTLWGLKELRCAP